MSSERAEERCHSRGWIVALAGSRLTRWHCDTPGGAAEGGFPCPYQRVDGLGGKKSCLFAVAFALLSCSLKCKCLKEFIVKAGVFSGNRQYSLGKLSVYRHCLNVVNRTSYI